MNNKIYELAKQAGLIEFETIPGSNAVTPDYESVVKAKKFAQLIVEECAQRAEAYAYMSQNFTALAEELRRMKQNG